MAEPSQSRVWFITGCSSGFGYELVQAVLQRGDKVIATARRTSSLSHLQSNDNVKILELDVTAADQVVKDKVEQGIAAFGQIDVLVNNAGYVLSGVWEELSAEDINKVFDTNVFGALKLNRAVLAHMRPKRSGTIFFMGSIAGWYGSPGGGGYSATKFALEGAAESLHREVKPFNIRVHILIIGRFRTNILSRTVSTLDVDGIPDYAALKKEKADNLGASNGTQPGDPLMAVKKIVDIARVENLTEEQARSLPLRIPLGEEAVKLMKRECKDVVAALEGWEEFAASSDFPKKK